ncbi:hypothetical protein CROQUDRAFT_92356 [Cronartium quercuum f. sp. fusiforme G11]|uniref:Uncharacterized protein n=1 Tax=Cronartium quercuum f. sp. fusiforme G11 TaxID=708437 RepID=A0A9P6TCI1_9BASI|nr:hypothetical protein CROQUDRAFT_92356 [Cronartium quercuum f. sp. fusiforme G11]
MSASSARQSHIPNYVTTSEIFVDLRKHTYANPNSIVSQPISRSPHSTVSAFLQIRIDSEELRLPVITSQPPPHFSTEAPPPPYQPVDPPRYTETNTNYDRTRDSECNQRQQQPQTPGPNTRYLEKPRSPRASFSYILGRTFRPCQSIKLGLHCHSSTETIDGNGSTPGQFSANAISKYGGPSADRRANNKVTPTCGWNHAQ